MSPRDYRQSQQRHRHPFSYHRKPSTQAKAMFANSRLPEFTTCIRLARMSIRATISGSELLLIVIAIRLAVLVLVSWGLTLLPRQARDNEPACVLSSATKMETQPATTVGARVADAAFEDMRLHD